jgi:hypothetical protein
MENDELRLQPPLLSVLRGLRTLLAAARPLVSLRTLQETLLPAFLSVSIGAVDLRLLDHETAHAMESTSLSRKSGRMS